MKCKGGKHEWTDPINAGRCCDPHWSRQLRQRGDDHDLDPDGRIHDESGMVHGWVYQNPAMPFVQAVAEALSSGESLDGFAQRNLEDA